MVSHPPLTVYDPVGRCIYCRAEGTRSEPLGKEHVVPYGLGGDWILPRASCRACAKITSAIETQCQRAMFGTARVRMRLPTRRREGHPTTLPVEFIREGAHGRRIVPADEAPMAFLGFQFLVPGLLRSAPPAADTEVKLVAMLVQDEALTRLGPELGRFKLGTIRPGTFARMLAKIAHAYVVANWGLDSFQPLLPDLILGRPGAAPALHLVGGDPRPPEPETVLHRVYRQTGFQGGRNYIVVAIRLFAFSGLPRYHVVVGEPRGGFGVRESRGGFHGR
jgi:hypothetical protein